MPDVSPKLILDHTAYNPDFLQPDGAFWVGDLELKLDLELLDLARGAAVLLELVEGDRTYRCRIDAANGTATLSYFDTLPGAAAAAAAADGSLTPIETELATGVTGVVGPGEYELAFANVDDRLTLWVDGDPVGFTDHGFGVDYPPYTATRVQEPTDGDLTPAGFAVKNLAARAAGLTVRRDIYYRGSFRDPDDLGPAVRKTDALGRRLEYDDVEYGRLSELAAAADDPQRYGPRYRRTLLADNARVDGRVYELTLGADEFLMLGDNSPSSVGQPVMGEHPRRPAAARGPAGRPGRHGVRHLLAARRAGLVPGRGRRRAGLGLAEGPGLNRWFYHVGTDGRLVTSYQEHGVPFLPNFGRLFKRIR